MLEIHMRHAYLEAENKNALLSIIILFCLEERWENCGTKRGG